MCIVPVASPPPTGTERDNMPNIPVNDSQTLTHGDIDAAIAAQDAPSMVTYADECDRVGATALAADLRTWADNIIRQSAPAPGPQIIDTGHGDMVAIVHTVDGHDMFQCMTCSGPVDTAGGWRVTGPVVKGDVLRLAYNYDTDDYVPASEREAGNYWCATVVRINRLSITVRSNLTGNKHKVQFTF